MNFFEYQEAARRQTRWLVFYYVLAVALIILTLYVVTVLIFNYADSSTADRAMNAAKLWNPTLLGTVAIFTGTLILIGSLYKIASLSSGGEAVARMLDGRPIEPQTRQLEERRLLNVVEEMAIASGTPIPRVFVMDSEPGINAFAAGFSPKDAVIGVTRGALETLNREELQGVIGHEFSHILNGDMRLNIRLIGVLNGILVIALTGYWMFRLLAHSDSGRSRDKKGNGLAALALLGLAMMVIGYIGVFFARLIKSAVSRQREFLADASSVQFTRNPTGLSNALKKIGGLATGSRLTAPSAESASHLFFANGISLGFINLLATHPPLEERIRRLDPAFLASEGGILATPPPVAQSEANAPAELSIAAAAPFSPTPGQTVSRAGTLTTASLNRAAQLLHGVPDRLAEAARSPRQAQAILLGLVLDGDEAIRERQHTILAKQGLSTIQSDLALLSEQMAAVPRESRPALASLATATLKQLTPQEYARFRIAAMALIAADAQVTLFEYMVMRMIVRNLDPRFGIGKRPRTHLASLSSLAPETGVVLSALCWFGTETQDRAAKAFAAGLKELGPANLELLQPAAASLDAMDRALDKLAEATPPLKQKLIAAFTATVTTDGVITTDEGEALRAVADALDCPLPPFLQAS